MSERKIFYCDFCRTRCDDIYQQMDWIKIEGSDSTFSVTLTKGRDEAGSAKTKWINTDRLDFCTHEHFIKFMENLK